MKRKEFLTTTGRLLLLGGLVATAGYLTSNKKVSAVCTVSTGCKNCGKFSNCKLPQAKEVQNEKKQ